MVWVTTGAFSIATKIFSPVSLKKFCVTKGFVFGAGIRCLGCGKGPLVLRQSFLKAGLFLSRQKILCHDRFVRVVLRQRVSCRDPQTRPVRATKR